MIKTKLGITVGLMGTIIYFSAAFGGGYLISVILCGYVLLVEDNPWLRKTSVKSILILIAFSLLSFLIEIIPDVFSIISSLISVFGGYISTNFISGVNVVLSAVLSLSKALIFVILGVKALSQGSIKILVIDKMIEKYMD